MTDYKKAVPVLDTEDESAYDADLVALYEEYQSEQPDYFIIEQEV